MNEDHLKASGIAKQVKQFARETGKIGLNFREYAELIENKIKELGGKPAFPVNLSENEIAAHYTPHLNEEKTITSEMVLKVDIGVDVNGWLVDYAITIDFTGENKELVDASLEALEKAVSLVKPGVEVGFIGGIIQETIESHGFKPIENLSGHAVEQNNLHAGIEFPNVKRENSHVLASGDVFAIEPFTSTGRGYITESDYADIYSLISDKPIRNPVSRKLLEVIKKDYEFTPFCSRWLGIEEYNIGLRELVRNGNLEAHNVLVEEKGSRISQFETTLIVTDSGSEVLV
ncbi:Methionine aminopeptidase [uncultured archaeon]|nr:Methionine aminopeptidase [uncultured archaeon]